MPIAQYKGHVSRAHRRTVFEVRESTTDPYAVQTVKDIAPSVKYVAIVAGVFTALAIISILLWKVYVWRKQKNARPSGSLASKITTERNSYTNFGPVKVTLSPTNLEKPKAAYGLTSSPSDEVPEWTPQLTNYRGVQMTPKSLAAIQTSPKKYAKWEKSLQLSREKSRSPPAYVVDRDTSPSVSPASIALPASPPETHLQTTPPITPPSSKSRLLTPPGHTQMPSPSRSSSFARQQSANLSNKPISQQLMKVVNTFTPSLDDEIAINIGETVRLLEEYQDGWCFVQRKDSRKGVVPRFCLVDRPSRSASPGQNHHNREGSKSSTSSV